MNFDSRALDWLRAHHATIAPGTRVADGVLLSATLRRRLVGTGELQRVVHGGYAFGGVELDELTRCAAVCTSHPAPTVGGPTAARLWQLRRAPNDGLVHVIAPPMSNPCRAAWVRTYPTAAPAAEDVVCWPDGIRVTSPPRTAVDMTRYVSEPDLVSLIEHVLEQQMCSESTLRRVAGRLDRPGRPWVHRFLGVLAARAGDAPAESAWERTVHDRLRRHGVDGLVRQHWVDLPDHGPARFDLAVPAIRWSLQVDVHPEHRSLEGAACDNRRDAAADVAGWMVRRVAELQLTSSLDSTITDIAASIARRRAAVTSFAPR